MFSKILAPIITPNATAILMNLSAVFTRVEVLKTFTPPFHHNASNFNTDGVSQIRPGSAV
jgi:hypothetical protein